mmetsp:Transcript_24832/g.44664  ORF Transcript_24832/g.44664 Transcript_24832/m.44664 type:complete len:370 (+) Transcript_24832:186-1295(+)
MTTTFTITPEQRNALLSKDDQQIGAAFLSMRETYEREGFVRIRGLLDDQLLKRICSAGEALTDTASLGNLFTSLDFGAIFNFQDDGKVNGDAFRETALDSAIPAFIAKVLLRIPDEEEDNTTLRLLKDAFMAKGKEQKHCGWHVDDYGFWPTDSSSTGVNSWLALDDMLSKYGGGMAVSPRSHTAEWRQQAYETIGSTPVIPPEGVDFTKPIGQTCDMASLDPDLNERIESTKLEMDYKAGDCLFCDRWLFHRSVAMNDEGLDYYGDDVALKRYTIRYERGTARLINGISFEPAILLNPDNSGKTLDDVCESDGPYYPLVSPPLDERRCQVQKSKMKSLAQERFPAVQEKKNQVMKEISAMMKKDATSY